ncbi:hypothetical protein ACFLSY_10285, partial [Bacteroidota bacterium]
LLPYFSAAASILVIFGVYTSVKNFTDKNDDKKDVINSEVVLENLDIPDNTQSNISEEINNTDEKIIIKQDTIKTKRIEKTPVAKKPIPVSNTKLADVETIQKQKTKAVEPQVIPDTKDRRKPMPTSIFSPRQKLLTNTEIRMEESVTNTATDKEYMSVLQYAGKEFKKRVLKKNDPENEKLSFWDIADVGMRGYNLISGKEAQIKRKYNSEGKLTNVGLNTESYEFQTRIRK